MSEPRFHPVAGIFPMMSAEEIDRLSADIAANGQKEPIYTHDGQIVDGRNRFMACRKAGVSPWMTPWNGKGSLVGFVVSLNLHRRHLDESQRGMVAAKIATLEKGSNQHASIEAPTQGEAAEMLNVGRATVQRAREVVERGTPELVDAVQTGRVAVSTAADVAELTHEEQREIVAKGEKEILAAAKKIRAEKTEERRLERVAKIVAVSANNKPLDGSVGLHAVIYADPPWSYDNDGVDVQGVAANEYPTMPLADIQSLPVNGVATPDSILYLWSTSPLLPEALSVMASWGFRYKSHIIWDKERMGTGYWCRVRHELLLIGIRGGFPTPPPALRPESIIAHPISRHSAKPEVFAELIEKLHPELPKIELFSRSPRRGWSAWGNEAGAAKETA